MSEKIEKRSVTALNPNNYEEAWRMATAIQKSGLAPKGYNTAEAIFVAMQMGSELGLAPMASIQNIIVINGKPYMEAAAQTGVAEAAGKIEWIKHTYEGEGATRSCRVVSKRTDKAEPCSPSSYSIADAKNAGLMGKDSWKGYPDRMLLARARGYHMRDNYKDVLLGIASLTAEEAMDLGPERARDVSPKADRGAQFLSQHDPELPPKTPMEAPQETQIGTEAHTPTPDPETSLGEENLPPEPPPEVAPDTPLNDAQQQVRNYAAANGMDIHTLQRWCRRTRERWLQDMPEEDLDDVLDQLTYEFQAIDEGDKIEEAKNFIESAKENKSARKKLVKKGQQEMLP